MLDLLSRLVDKSLVVVQERGGEARYRLLETVRQYGREKLLESGEVGTVRRRHASFFLALAEEVEPKINDTDRGPWLAYLEAEHDNLRAALRWSAETGEAETGLRLAGALWQFWFHRGYGSEARGWLEGALERGERGRAPARTVARAKALLGAGTMAWEQGDRAAARSRLEESVALWRELKDEQGLALALQLLSVEMLSHGEHTVARSLAEESVAMFRRIGTDAFGLAISLAALGLIVVNQGDYALGSSLLEESIAISRKAGDNWALSLPLRNLAVAAFKRGDYDRAAALLEESLIVLRELGEKQFITRSLD
jgi:tetratricopeptide (TPR) repeat protein